MNKITYIEIALIVAVVLEFAAAFLTAGTRPDIAELAYVCEEDSNEQDTEDSTQGTQFIDSQMERAVMPPETRVKLEAMIKKSMDYIDGGNDEETN